MTMTKSKLCIIAPLVGGILATCWLKHSLDSKFAENQESLRRQAETFARLREENEHLLNAISNLKNSPLSREQFRNLIRLRGEVARLRWTKLEEDAIRSTNQQLAKLLPNVGTNDSYWSGNELAFVGYAEPEAAMKTTLWVFASGDINSFLASQTPESRAQFDGLSQAEIEMYAKAIAKLSFNLGSGGAQVVKKEIVSETDATLDVYYEEDEKTRRFALKKFGNEWKISNLVSISN